MFDEDWGIEVNPDVEPAQVQEALIGILTGEWAVEDTVLKGGRFEMFNREGLRTTSDCVLFMLRGGREFLLPIIRYR